MQQRKTKKEQINAVEEDMGMCDLLKEDAVDQEKWQQLSWKATGQTLLLNEQ